MRGKTEGSFVGESDGKELGFTDGNKVRTMLGLLEGS